jgi:transcriptional regulator with XRE-family HTH domain
MTSFCRLRRFLGLTQLDVEIATGISVRRLSLAENGSVKLTDSEECAVSEYLAAPLRIVNELEFKAREIRPRPFRGVSGSLLHTNVRQVPKHTSSRDGGNSQRDKSNEQQELSKRKAHSSIIQKKRLERP